MAFFRFALPPSEYWRTSFFHHLQTRAISQRHKRIVYNVELKKKELIANLTHHIKNIDWLSLISMQWRCQIQFSSVQFKTVSKCSENPYVFCPISEKFPQCCLFVCLGGLDWCLEPGVRSPLRWRDLVCLFELAQVDSAIAGKVSWAALATLTYCPLYCHHLNLKWTFRHTQNWKDQVTLLLWLLQPLQMGWPQFPPKETCWPLKFTHRHKSHSLPITSIHHYHHHPTYPSNLLSRRSTSSEVETSYWLLSSDTVWGVLPNTGFNHLTTECSNLTDKLLIELVS